MAPPTYSWTPDIPATATYEVYAKWPADSGHASNAEYVIQTPSGSDLVPVDQRSNGGTWQLLGSFTLEAGTGNSVILNADLADGLAIADAVRITRAVNLGEAAYLHTDHLGTPQKMTDATGSIVWDRVARPFGATESESGSLATDLRFPGQLFDAESGLYYNYFRDYDPTLGRYIQSDPIGLNGGINTYAYARSSPARYIDPTGQNPAAALLACLANPACAAAIGLGVGGALMSQSDLPQSKSGPTENDICETDGEDDDDCGPLTRRQALAAAQEWAGVPRQSRGREPIPFSSIGESSRGPNAARIQGSGGTHAGYSILYGRNSVRDHPDGHPHLTGEGQPHYHKCPHVHAVNGKGEEMIFTYKRGL